MPSPEPHDEDLLSLANCTACGHRESGHDDLGCFLRPDAKMRDEYSDDLETRQGLKGTGAECWCCKFETDIPAGIDAVLKNGPPRAIVAATDAAVNRKDVVTTEKLLDRYIRKTVPNEREADWVNSTERSIARLRSDASPGRISRPAADYGVGPEGQEEFKHSDDYCSIAYRGVTYNLTASAGRVVGVLYGAYTAGKVGIGSAEIKKRCNCGRVWDQFRRRDGRKFWRALIGKTEKDFFKLTLRPL